MEHTIKILSMVRKGHGISFNYIVHLEIDSIKISATAVLAFKPHTAHLVMKVYFGDHLIKRHEDFKAINNEVRKMLFSIVTTKTLPFSNH